VSAVPQTCSRDVAPCSFADQVTVVITNYNGQRVLGATLSNLRDEAAGCRIVLVDDGSTDGALSTVPTEFPHVEIISMGKNTAMLNRVRNRGLNAATTPYVLLIDNDVTFTRGSIERMLAVVASADDVLCCTPRLLYQDDPSRMYSDEQTLHYLCASCEPVPGGVNDMRPRGSMGGGIMLINRSLAETLGGFDDNFMLGWGDDGEFHLRGWLAGYRTLHDPTATVLLVVNPHGTGRVCAQFYNRLRTIAISYSARTIVVCGPALLLFELLLVIMCAAEGLLPNYLRALRKFRHDLGDIRARRKQVQTSRKISDRRVLVSGVVATTGGADSRLHRLASKALGAPFNLYWRLARTLL
jgi:GT2 family glycosyltransferase